MSGNVRGPLSDLRIRNEPRAADARAIRDIVTSSANFSPVEIEMAVELLEERLARGRATGYEFLFAEAQERVCGYACYGPIPLTSSSWDLYWIAVASDLQGGGLGHRLLAEVESCIAVAGGARIYVDTSGRAAYDGTRAFYERRGYRMAARLDDFYGPGDAKVIYLKVIDSAR